MSTVTIRKRSSAPPATRRTRPRRVNLGRHLERLEIQPADVLGWSADACNTAMAAYTDVRPRRFTISSEPTQSKFAKAASVGALQTGVSYANDRLELADGTILVTCPWADRHVGGCVENCIAETGRMGFDIARNAREWRTTWLYRDPISHIATMMREIAALARMAERQGLTPVYRPDTTSNIRWPRVLPWLADVFPTVEFVDYDRSPDSATYAAAGWSVAHSMNARKDPVGAIFAMVESGVSASVIVDDPAPLLEMGAPFADADASDLWMVTDVPVAGLLKAKRPMRQDHPTVYRAADIIDYMRGATS